MCPAWLLVAVVIVGGARGAASECWEHPVCQELDSESSLMECVQLCRSDLTDETPVIPGSAHLLQVSPPALSDPAPSVSDSAPQTKRSYSMEHFRWGKPVGRKRRPVKVYTSNGVEEESSEAFPGEIKRALANQLLSPEQEEAELKQEVLLENVASDIENGGVDLLGGLQQKKDGSTTSTYKMKHFRWSGPPAAKRYGGFMKSWDERSQRPLLTLFKNVINKDGQQQV